MEKEKIREKLNVKKAKSEYEKWQERNDLIDETEESQSGFVIGNQGKFNLESFEEQKREKKKVELGGGYLFYSYL